MTKPLNQRILARIARQAGFDLLRRKPLDLRGRISNPLDAVYLCGLLNCVIDVPIEHCRSSLAYAYGACEHPFAATLKEFLEGKISSYRGSLLESQHRTYQPQTIAECLALEAPDSQPWRNLPLQARVMPWEKVSPTEKMVQVELQIAKDNVQRGAKLDVSAGLGIVGPVTQQKGQLEYEALVKLIRSVEQHGYRRHDGVDGDIFAVMLISNSGETRFLIRQGTHRINALDALSYKTIPIRIVPARSVRVAEAGSWPHVRDGMYRVDEAVKLFSRLFEGQPFLGGRTT
jgi:hypothetical protein